MLDITNIEQIMKEKYTTWEISSAKVVGLRCTLVAKYLGDLVELMLGINKENSQKLSKSIRNWYLTTLNQSLFSHM